MDKFPYLKFLTIGFIFFVLLILFRNWYFGKAHIFLIWNVFLACLPMVFIYFIKHINRFKFLHYPLFLFWFLFLPNAPYVITDFIHLKYRLGIVFWFDLIIFFYAAFFSIVVGVIALEEGRIILKEIVKKKWFTNTVISLSILLSGFGVYLGRFPRFNSWHVFTQPKETILGFFEHGMYVLTQKESLVFVCLFSGIFGIGYLGFRILKRE